MYTTTERNTNKNKIWKYILFLIFIFNRRLIVGYPRLIAITKINRPAALFTTQLAVACERLLWLTRRGRSRSCARPVRCTWGRCRWRHPSARRQPSSHRTRPSSLRTGRRRPSAGRWRGSEAGRRGRGPCAPSQPSPSQGDEERGGRLARRKSEPRTPSLSKQQSQPGRT